MPRSRLIAVSVAFALLAGGVVYWRWTILRTAPVLAARPTFDVVDTGDVKHVVPLSEIIASGPAKDGMPPIDKPSFESVAAADQYLKDDGLGIDIANGKAHRFYPFQVLAWHVAVNDTIAGKPILVAFCPLCREGAVFRRTLGDRTLQFGTAGQVWNGMTLLYARPDEGVWAAAAGFALTGPDAGAQLEPYPFRVVTWSRWKSAYPDGAVLKRESGSNRDYTLDPYGRYATDQNLLFPVVRSDIRHAAKGLVFGAVFGKDAVAYAAKDAAKKEVIDDMLDQRPITIWGNRADSTAVAFRTDRPGGTRLTFQLNTNDQITDRETGSLWYLDGTAVSGPLRGTTLEPVPLFRGFWYCWAGVHPETRLYALP